MFNAIKFLLAASAMLFAGASAWAQEIAMFAEPTSPYQGQRTFTADDTTFTQAVYSKPGKTRSEMNIDGTQIIQIWRMDREVIWSLMPDQRMAMELSLGSDQAASPLDAYRGDEAGSNRFEMRLIGPDNVNGVNANRYYISGTHEDGSKADGHVWTTAQNITVRMRITSTAPGEPSNEFRYDLTDLILRDQPDSLFEVPGDYQVISMASGYPGIPGMNPGAEDDTVNPVGDYAGDVAKSAADEAAREADRRVRNKARDEARKAVRKVLPW